MDNTVQGIWVNPTEQSVGLVSLPKGEGFFPALYKALGVQMVSVVRAEDLFGGAGGAFLYVDDMGLYCQNQSFTLVQQTPIAGKFVILRVSDSLEDDESDEWLQSVDFTVDTVRSKIHFITQKQAQDILDRGTDAAAKVYESMGLKVVRNGNTLFVTEGD